MVQAHVVFCHVFSALCRGDKDKKQSEQEATWNLVQLENDNLLTNTDKKFFNK